MKSKKNELYYQENKQEENGKESTSKKGLTTMQKTGLGSIVAMVALDIFANMIYPALGANKVKKHVDDVTNVKY